MYIHDAYRHQGIGSAALEYIIQQSPSLGIQTLLVFIFAHNEASIKLAEKAGFEIWGHLPDVAEMDGKKYSLKILGRKV